MSKQTFSIFQIFALYFPFCMRPYDARSSVTLEKLGFVVREPQSHLELTYFLPKFSAFMLISGNWANFYISVSSVCEIWKEFHWELCLWEPRAEPKLNTNWQESFQCTVIAYFQDMWNIGSITWHLYLICNGTVNLLWHCPLCDCQRLSDFSYLPPL